MNKLPRGIVNKNPGNIRKSKDEWVGEIDGNDESFKTFQEMGYGIRALLVIFLRYQQKYHLKTIRGLINRYAPPNENETNTYVTNVAAILGIDPDKEIDLLTQPWILEKLARAVIIQENGKDATKTISDEDIQTGVKMALNKFGIRGSDDS